MVLYPNPSNGEIKMKLFAEAYEPFDIKIINLQGNRIQKTNLLDTYTVQNLVNIPTELLRNGTYQVFVIDKEGNKISEKVIIQK
jgi:hypothetical protein